jgi:hypothetical protein
VHAQENSADPRVEALKPSVGRSPSYREPCQIVAARQHRFSSGVSATANPIIGREDV